MDDQKGNREDWVELSSEENRCLMGLKKYYMAIEEKPEEEATEKAWIDLKREFGRLESYKWYR